MPEGFEDELKAKPEEILLKENQYSRSEQADKLLHFMGKLKADEVFANEDSKRKYLSSLNFGNFMNLLTATNALLRNKPINERSIDGKTVFLKPGALNVDEAYIPPDYEDKNSLLQQMFNNVKTMSEDKRSLEDIGLLAAAGINAIHPFNDANGRTSRLIYTLLTKDYTGQKTEQEYLSQILDEEGRFSIDINPVHIRNYFHSLIATELGLDATNPLLPVGFWIKDRAYRHTVMNVLEANNNISKENKGFLEQIISSDEGLGFQDGFFAIYQFLKDKSKANDNIITFYDSEEKPIRSRILIDKTVLNFSDDDTEKIKQNYYAIKRKYVETLFEIVSNPEKHPKKESDGTLSTWKDYFKKEIERRKES